MVIQIPGAAASDFVSYVQHGATASTARTAGADVVLWDGSVDPDNKVSGDYWWDTGNDQWKRYDGSSWVTASGTYPGSGGGAAQQVVSSGDKTLNSTSWADVPGTVEATVDAKAGDIIEVACSGLWGSEAVTGILDAASIVGGSPVNYVGAGTVGGSGGVRGWAGPSGLGNTFGASVLYTVQAGDISSGQVTMRLRYYTSAASNKSLRGSNANRLFFSVVNHG